MQEFTAPLGHVLYILIPTTHLNHGKLSHAFTIHGSLYYIYVHAPLMRHRCKSQGGASS